MIPASPTPPPAPKASPMRRLARHLPVLLPTLLLCGGAHAMKPDESPAGWWAPTLRDCADPASPRAFEIRLKPQAEARLQAHDLDCRIDKVSDTAIGYRLHMRCFRSPEDRRAGTNAEPRQIVVDAIGPVTMRADGRRVYRCRSRPAAAIGVTDRVTADAAPASPAGMPEQARPPQAAQTSPAAQTPQAVQAPPPMPAPQASVATVPALPLPDAPIRLVSLTPDAPPVRSRPRRRPRRLPSGSPRFPPSRCRPRRVSCPRPLPRPSPRSHCRRCGAAR